MTPLQFKLLMNDSRLQSIPKVLEIPKGKGEKDWDQMNLMKLRGFFEVKLAGHHSYSFIEIIFW